MVQEGLRHRMVIIPRILPLLGVTLSAICHVSWSGDLKKDKVPDKEKIKPSTGIWTNPQGQVSSHASVARFETGAVEAEI